jgi:hypothetical protein
VGVPPVPVWWVCLQCQCRGAGVARTRCQPPHLLCTLISAVYVYALGATPSATCHTIHSGFFSRGFHLKTQEGFQSRPSNPIGVSRGAHHLGVQRLRQVRALPARAAGEQHGVPDGGSVLSASLSILLMSC